MSGGLDIESSSPYDLNKSQRISCFDVHPTLTSTIQIADKSKDAQHYKDSGDACTFGDHVFDILPCGEENSPPFSHRGQIEVQKNDISSREQRSQELRYETSARQYERISRKIDVPCSVEVTDEDLESDITRLILSGRRRALATHQASEVEKEVLTCYRENVKLKVRQKKLEQTVNRLQMQIKLQDSEKESFASELGALKLKYQDAAALLEKYEGKAKNWERQVEKLEEQVESYNLMKKKLSEFRLAYEKLERQLCSEKEKSKSLQKQLDKANSDLQQLKHTRNKELSHFQEFQRETEKRINEKLTLERTRTQEISDSIKTKLEAEFCRQVQLLEEKRSEELKKQNLKSERNYQVLQKKLEKQVSDATAKKIQLEFTENQLKVSKDKIAELTMKLASCEINCNQKQLALNHAYEQIERLTSRTKLKKIDFA
ncbi:uncharacterized protein LOC126320367 [Schistocerca gregaria]|uniref:uncharacterized protein LOC126320367 n=1 Tax=Schistocerca gregaria TaxID=7010 RepID=UPI00211ED6B3|nr:uncharacterized protein LOC126320367 [Schistocerca gregaria]